MVSETVPPGDADPLKGEIMDELFDEIAGVIKAGSEAVHTGLVLGRAESEKRIKELEAENAILKEELAESRYLSSNGTGGCSGNTGTTVISCVPNGFKGVAKKEGIDHDRKQSRIFPEDRQAAEIPQNHEKRIASGKRIYVRS